MKADRLVIQVEIWNFLLSRLAYQKQLRDVRLFGYHSEQLYKRAAAYLEDVKNLLRVCERARDFVLGKTSSSRLPTTGAVAEASSSSSSSRTLRSQQKQQQQQEEEARAKAQEEHVLEFQVKRHPRLWPWKAGGGGAKTVTHIEHRSIDLRR